MSLRPHCLTQYVFPLAALLLAGSAHAADFELHPSITVNEEFTDNISEDQARTLGSEFLTRAIPGLAFTYSAPFWIWDVGYKYEYRYYAQNKRASEDLHKLKASTRLTLIDEKLFLDISDEYSRVSLDQSRDRTQESLYTNQSDQNTLVVSPNFLLRPTSKLTLRPAASYQNIWYKDPTGVGRDIYSGYLNSDYEITDKFSIISSYVFIVTDAKGSLSRTHNLLTGIKYEYAKDSFISAQGGYSWFLTDQDKTANPLWNLSANYAGERYNFRAGAGEKYSNDPTSNKITLNSNYDLGFDWKFDRGSAGITSGIVRVENIPGNSVFSISYNNSISMKYEIFKDWEANIAYSFNYIDIRHSNTYTEVSLLNSGITYSYSADTKIRLNYRYLHMFSPDLLVDNKDVNNILFEISKSF